MRTIDSASTVCMFGIRQENNERIAMAEAVATKEEAVKPVEKPVVQKPVDLRPLIAAELSRKGLKTIVIHMPGTVNYRVRWLNEEGREVESKFLLVQQNGDKLNIIDRTGKSPVMLKESVTVSTAKKEKSIFGDTAVLPVAEKDE